MGEFTKGPWNAKELGGSFDEPRWVILWPDTSKGGVHMRRLDDHGEFDKEDAQVMAAAPDLLEAMELILADCEFAVDDMDGSYYLDRADVEKARSAIARARGEA